MKKLIFRTSLGIGTLGLIVSVAAAFSAFEAHVINVTARIQNALSVETGAMEFEEVFPQQYLTKDLQITLSDSFKKSGRVDDVEYVIKQKPKVKEPCDFIKHKISVVSYNSFLGIKTAYANNPPPTSNPCGDPSDNPAPGDPYLQINVPFVNPHFQGPAWQFCEEYLPFNAPYGTYEINNIYWHLCYIPLANYLSKHKAEDEKGTTIATDWPDVDKEVDAFHFAYEWANFPKSNLAEGVIAKGKLQKSAGDTEDTWVIDLAVPCFKGFCAQDWADFVHKYNPEADADKFVLPKALEHKVFGTDLWVEVTGISENVEEPTGE